MHGFKHSSETVTGVLIGSINQKAVQIVDAVPLFHTHALAPMLKVAFTLIEKHCQLEEKQIVGLYYANDKPSDTISHTARVMADKVLANSPGASLWSLNAEKI